MKKTAAICSLFIVPAFFVFSDPVALYESGKSAQDQEDWYGAIESYQESLRENPSYNLAYRGLAESFYALGEYEQALDQVTKAESYKKNDPELLDLRGFTQIGLGKLDAASATFKQVLTTWPNDVSARFGIAEIDICSGKISAASDQYLDALKRNPENRKALLSLALISRESGNVAAAKDYIAKALQYHGDNPQVFYYAAYIAAEDGQLGEAEKRVRSALGLKSDYDDARELLASILFRTKRYAEVLQICDARIASNRNRASAWYLKTLSLEKLGKYEDALKSAKTGLQVAPEDEVLRSMMESIVIAQLSFEDSRRASWASYHVDKARQFEQNNMNEQALYEYRRALKINPYDVDSRQSYAKLLLNRGYPARYVGQLKFIQSIGKSTNAINDAVESYGKLLSTSIAQKWKLDPLYLDKAHTSIGLYYQSDTTNIAHPDSERITTGMLADVFSSDLRYKVRAQEIPVGSYSEAFRISREAGEDYFGIVRFRENARDIQITVDLYVSRTGAKANTFSVFRTANDRYANALRRLIQTMSASFPSRGVVLGRYQAEGSIDLGKSDGVKPGAVFEVFPSSSVSVKNAGIGLLRNEASVLGTFTVDAVDEDVSQGKFERSGFYDRINSGDVVLPKIDKAGAGKTAGATETAASQKQVPALLSLLRKIR